MAAIPLMTWTPPRWAKTRMIGGKRRNFAVSPKQLAKLYPDMVIDNTKLGSLAAANRWWKEQEAALTNTLPRPYQQAITVRVAMHKWYLRQGMASDAERVAKEIAELEQSAAAKAPRELERHEVQPLRFLPPESAAIWQARFAEVAELPAAKINHVMPLVDQFMAQRNYRNPQAEANTRRQIAKFIDFVAVADAAAITEQHLSNYRANLIGQMKAGKLSSSSAADAITYAFAFAQFLFKVRIIGELRLTSADMRITATHKKQKPWTDEQVKTLLAKVEKGTLPELCYLLMLNTGANKIDLANLSQDDILLDCQSIRRKRSKTEHHENVPEVIYPLWQRTWDLLLKFRSKDGNRALLGPGGNPLVTSKPKNDYIATLFSRWNIANELKLPPLKNLRHTCASKFDGGDYERYSVYFMGHSPKGILAKHYKTPDAAQFRAAITWLGKQWGIE